MRNALTETVFGDQLDKKLSLADAIAILHKMNLFNMGELSEKYAAKEFNSPQCAKNTPAIDLENGVQVKYGTVQPYLHGTGNQRRASISIRGTQRLLHCVVHDPSNDLIYLFEIPPEARRGLTGNTLTIQFNENSRARRSKWWQYQVKKFNMVPG